MIFFLCWYSCSIQTDICTRYIERTVVWTREEKYEHELNNLTWCSLASQLQSCWVVMYTSRPPSSCYVNYISLSRLFDDLLRWHLSLWSQLNETLCVPWGCKISEKFQLMVKIGKQIGWVIKVLQSIRQSHDWWIINDLADHCKSGNRKGKFTSRVNGISERRHFGCNYQFRVLTEKCWSLQ